jgi:hypothetical protein
MLRGISVENGHKQVGTWGRYTYYLKSTTKSFNKEKKPSIDFSCPSSGVLSPGATLLVPNVPLLMVRSKFGCYSSDQTSYCHCRESSWTFVVNTVSRRF